MTIKPITPEQVAELKENTLPDQVLEAFNELIAAHWDGRQSVVSLAQVIALIRSKLNQHKDPVPARWLDIEEIYRKAGWSVKYEQPGYCESGPSLFTFRRK